MSNIEQELRTAFAKLNELDPTDNFTLKVEEVAPGTAWRVTYADSCGWADPMIWTLTNGTWVVCWKSEEDDEIQVWTVEA